MNTEQRASGDKASGKKIFDVFSSKKKRGKGSMLSDDAALAAAMAKPKVE